MIEEEEEEEDLRGSVWIPVIVDSKMDKSYILEDPNIKEMDLAAISEKEVFVRKANLVSFHYQFLIAFLIE